jgi:uncharacterized protein (DUF2384 family)
LSSPTAAPFDVHHLFNAVPQLGDLVSQPVQQQEAGRALAERNEVLALTALCSDIEIRLAKWVWSKASPPFRRKHMEKVVANLDASKVLTKATIRASKMLGLSGAALARTIGLSEPTVSRLLHGDKLLDPSSKEGELALLLVRVFRSLNALVGTDDQKRLVWMTTHNKALGGVPQQLVQSAAGLVTTLNYLDGMRAPEYLPELEKMAKDTFGSHEAASAWLRRPHPMLEGDSPVEAAKTSHGTERVKGILAAIKYGGVA